MDDDDLDDEIIQEFLTEAHEGLDRLEDDLMRLGAAGEDEDALIASVFRTVHTIKGTAGALEYTRLESLAHVAENLLSKIRDKAFSSDRATVDLLLGFADTVRNILASVEAHRSEGDTDVAPLVAQITELTQRKLTGSDPVQVESGPTADETGLSGPSPEGLQRALRVAPPPAGMSRKQPQQAEHAPSPEGSIRDAQSKTGSLQAGQGADPDHDGSTPSMGLLGEYLVAAGHVTKEQLVLALRDQQRGDPRRIGEILVARGSVAPDRIKEALEVQGDRDVEAKTVEAISVDVSLLDKLMNLVGELVLVRNQIDQYATDDQDRGFISASQRLNLITAELQEGVMQTRMQPIRSIWGKFPRMVRHLSDVCKKPAQVEMDGQDTELDRTIIEAIKDPLTHIVRNAVDHGLEPPELRAKRGKPATGTVSLRAYHEGGQVNILVGDDGGGLDPDVIREKAQKKGVVTAVQAARMSDREVLNLIFHPGFSTADTVTNVSGRGVGMDVVKTNVERIGGAIELDSTLGEGTTVSMKIPLTLAIIPVLLVKVGEERFALPQANLVEVVRLEHEQVRQLLASVHGAPVYRRRGHLLPLVYLDEQLAMERRDAADGINIVILQAGDHHFGLVVHEINDTAEIVVKPLSTQLKSIGVYTGATILGDGRVALILDVVGLAQRAKVFAASHQTFVEDADTAADADEKQTHQLLLLGVGERQRVAVPLSVVARLEEVPANDVELTQGQEVVQYRGELLPLFHVAEALGVPGRNSTTLQVFVYTHGGRSVGFVVDEVLDVVEDTVTRHEMANPAGGVRDAVVILGSVTDLFDVEGFIRERLPAFFERAV